MTKATGAKRKTANDYGSNKRAKTTGESPAPMKSRSQLQLEALELISSVVDVDGVATTPVYDSCPQLVKKIKDFLERPGMTKGNFCTALGGINANSLNKFLAGKGQDQCGNVTYRKSWVFFEKLRVLEGKPKSSARRKNEMERPSGFSLEKARPQRFFAGMPAAMTFIHNHMM